VKQIEFTIANQQIVVTKPLDVLADETINYVKCKFAFTTSDWDGTVRVALFKNQSFNLTGEALIDSDGYCDIPQYVLSKPGVIAVTVYGVINSPVTYKITTETCMAMKQTDAVSNSKTIPIPAPSAYEEYIRCVERSAKTVIIAKDKLANVVVNAHIDPAATEVRVVKTETDTELKLDFYFPPMGGGSSDHSQLSNRGIANQHPQSSITGLSETLVVISDEEINAL